MPPKGKVRPVRGKKARGQARLERRRVQGAAAAAATDDTAAVFSGSDLAAKLGGKWASLSPEDKAIILQIQQAGSDLAKIVEICRGHGADDAATVVVQKVSELDVAVGNLRRFHDNLTGRLRVKLTCHFAIILFAVLSSVRSKHNDLTMTYRSECERLTEVHSADTCLLCQRLKDPSLYATVQFHLLEPLNWVSMSLCSDSTWLEGRESRDIMLQIMGPNEEMVGVCLWDLKQLLLGVDIPIDRWLEEVSFFFPVFDRRIATVERFVARMPRAFLDVLGALFSQYSRLAKEEQERFFGGRVVEICKFWALTWKVVYRATTSKIPMQFFYLLCSCMNILYRDKANYRFIGFLFRNMMELAESASGAIYLPRDFFHAVEEALFFLYYTKIFAEEIDIALPDACKKIEKLRRQLVFLVRLFAHCKATLQEPSLLSDPIKKGEMERICGIWMSFLPEIEGKFIAYEEKLNWLKQELAKMEKQKIEQAEQRAQSAMKELMAGEAVRIARDAKQRKDVVLRNASHIIDKSGVFSEACGVEEGAAASGECVAASDDVATFAKRLAGIFSFSSKERAQGEIDDLKKCIAIFRRDSRGGAKQIQCQLLMVKVDLVYADYLREYTGITKVESLCMQIERWIDSYERVNLAINNPDITAFEKCRFVHRRQFYGNKIQSLLIDLIGPTGDCWSIGSAVERAINSYLGVCIALRRLINDEAVEDLVRGDALAQLEYVRGCVLPTLRTLPEELLRILGLARDWRDRRRESMAERRRLAAADGVAKPGVRDRAVSDWCFVVENMERFVDQTVEIKRAVLDVLGVVESDAEEAAVVAVPVGPPGERRHSYSLALHGDLIRSLERRASEGRTRSCSM